MTTDTPTCSLCGAPIPDGTPRESWDWHPEPDSDDVEVLYAHPGCNRLRTDYLDVAEWHQGSLVDMLAEWIDGSESLARAAEEAAAGCEYAETAVRSARRLGEDVP